MRGLWKRFRKTGEVVKKPAVRGHPKLQNLLGATVSLSVYRQVSVQVLLPLSPGNKTSNALIGLLHVAILLHLPNKTSQHSVSQVRCLAPGCTSNTIAATENTVLVQSWLCYPACH